MTTSTNTSKLKQPVIYTAADLASFLLHVTKSHISSTTIIVCSDRQTFLEQVVSSAQGHQEPQEEAATQSNLQRQPATPRLLSRTIHFLSSSQNVTLKFCNSVSTLQALLSSISHPSTLPTEHVVTNKEGKTPILGIVNPVALHQETASYSAQGLSKTFAAAIEASWRSGQALMIVECPSVSSQIRASAENGNGNTGQQLQADGDTEMADSEGHAADLLTALDPWEEQIPILNATTKTIGTAGDRAWLGRTVSVKDVVKRWFIFEPLHGS